mmetsp:Transcript_22579/g.85569  ORF Transcript_22579/g.85569 Transcript_22579/m.85569 type:complete len:259 (+) Transcript_22579:1844-2620(+)
MTGVEAGQEVMGLLAVGFAGRAGGVLLVFEPRSARQHGATGAEQLLALERRLRVGPGLQLGHQGMGFRDCTKNGGQSVVRGLEPRRSCRAGLGHAASRGFEHQVRVLTPCHHERDRVLGLRAANGLSRLHINRHDAQEALCRGVAPKRPAEVVAGTRKEPSHGSDRRRPRSLVAVVEASGHHNAHQRRRGVLRERDGPQIGDFGSEADGLRVRVSLKRGGGDQSMQLAVRGDGDEHATTGLRAFRWELGERHLRGWPL